MWMCEWEFGNGNELPYLLIVIFFLSFFSVMYLQFVPKTHLFFTAGKDHKIKQWDADKFEHIQTLEVK